MPLTTVNPNSTDIEHLASVDVEFSGTHIGGGIYLATNHDPNTDGRVRTAIPQRCLNGLGYRAQVFTSEYLQMSFQNRSRLDAALLAGLKTA